MNAQQADTKKVIFQQNKTVLDQETGELKEFELVTEAIVSREPDYVKLYLNTVLAAKNLPITHNTLLNEILLRMTYANVDEGQIIYILPYDREKIAKKLNIKPDTIKKAILDFAKAGILRKIANGKYQVNPHLFGKGDWSDIRRIRATFVFESPDIENPIIDEDNAEHEND